MKPFKVDEAKCRQQNSEFYARINKFYDYEDSNEDNEYKCSEIHKRSVSQHDIRADHQIDNIDQQPSSTSLNEMASIINHTSEHGYSESRYGQRRLGVKVDVVYSLLGMLGNSNGKEDMSATLLAMSNSIDSCLIMRQSGCLPLLIQLIHANGQNSETRERAARALHNVVHARGDEKVGRREARVLRLLEQIRDYCQMLRISLKSEQPLDDLERHPSPTIAVLMKLSFDEGHRHAMCQLGGLHAVTELIEIDHIAHGSDSDDQSCITLRRYAGMALTNLTFGDGNNKALLCSFRGFMKALVSQLRSLSDDLRQVTASVLRNLSWRADNNSKHTLKEIGAVTALMKAAMEGRKESTLKSILSALWNLSAHCSTNKVDICAVEGALVFLVDMLSYRAPSKTLSIIENAGGILRNVSSHIALREDYRAIIRDRGCLQVLLRQLRSPSLTVVSNACGTLWNLSARCPYDQRLLWDLGAVPMLRSLVHSKHKMISMGSSAALKNLLNARPYGSSIVHLDSTAKFLELPTLPSLIVRRQRALEQEIDQSLSETCDNIEPSISPTNKDDKFSFKTEPHYEDLILQKKSYQRCNNQVEIPPKIHELSRSESKESMRSVTSTHSDTIFERVSRYISKEFTPNLEFQSKQQSSSLYSAVSSNARGLTNVYKKLNQEEKRYALSYKNLFPKQLRLTEIDIDDRNMKSITSAISWAIADNQQSAYSLLQSSLKDELSSTESTESTISKRSNNHETFVSQHVSLNRIHENSSARSSVDSINLKESLKLINNPCFSHTSNHKAKSDLYGDYAETDLDEPTNYSLRYGEQNLDEDEKPTFEYLSDNEQTMEDTVKIYYTEGTPRNTPLNSSRAPSQSDLQYDKMKQLPEKNDLNKNEDIQYSFKANKSNILVNHNSHGSKKVLEYHKKLVQASPLCNHQPNNSNRLENFLEFQIDSPIVKNVDNTKSSSTNSPINDSTIKKKSTVTNDLYSIESKVIEKPNGIEVECLTESTTSDGDDDDENLLAACIHVGMQNNKHMQSFKKIFRDETKYDKNNLNCYYTKLTSDQTNVEITKKSICPLDLKSTNSNEIILLDSDKEKFTTNQKDLKSTKPTCVSKIKVDTKNNDKNNFDKESSLGQNSCQSVLLRSLSSESIASYDSVEKSEQVLLELCLKSELPKTHKGSLKEYDSPETMYLRRNLSFESLDPSEISNSVNIIEESKNQEMEKAYRRQRDPDAMIASLDRLTATLVQQTEAMREKESTTMKRSILSDSWNDDSPNDSSLPTISMSVPLIASFKSDIQEDTTINLSSSNKNTKIQPSKLETPEIIKNEALKVADAMTDDFNTINQTTQGLDDIKPPSLMNSILSLATSFIGVENSDNFSDWDEQNSTSLPSKLLKSRIAETYSRKKSLPVSIVTKRTLVKKYIRTGSLENLLNDYSIDYVSQLESIKPPSMMNDILDNGDMENSTLSVTSISSEIADLKNPNSVDTMNHDFNYGNIRSIIHNSPKIDITNAENSNSSIECLENINPPSLLNEISEINNIMMDTTENMCSETLCIDSQLHTDVTSSLNHDIIETATNDNNTDEAATPISTEYSSSAESTPKKLSKKQHITPKQRRQLAKDRFRTYTIAAKFIKKDGKDCAKKEKIETQVVRKKLTPKQRRKEDPSRFQTQILYSMPKPLDKTNTIKEPLVSLSQAVVTSIISDEQKLKNNISLHNDANSEYNRIALSGNACCSNIQTILTQNANIVLYTLNESHKADEPLLDCETLSLVSNDSDAERSIQICVSNLSKKKLNYSPSINKEIIENQPDVEIANKSEITEDISEASESENENWHSEKLSKKPCIINPNIRKVSGELITEKSLSNGPKSIRGRRKVLYSNPNKKILQIPLETINSNVTSSRSDTSSIIRTTKAVILKQNMNNVVNNDELKLGITQKTSSMAKNITSKKSSIPQRKTSLNRCSVKSVRNFSCSADNKISGNSKTLEQKPLTRQNTFVKDESNNDIVPPVVPVLLNKSKIAKPVKNQSGIVCSAQKKINTKSHKSFSQESKLANFAIGEQKSNPKIPTKIKSKRYSAIEIGIKKLSNNINYNNQTSKHSITFEKRSNSNSNIASSNLDLTKKLSKGTNSEVINSWNKIDESKNRRFQECKSQPCGIASNEAFNGNTNVKQSRLFRSSTFNGLITQVRDADVKCQQTFNETSHANSYDLPCLSTVNVSSKIPMRHINSKINEKKIENRIISSSKDYIPELLQTNKIKRTSVVHSIVSDIPSTRNYTQKSKVFINTSQTNIEENGMTEAIVTST